METIAVFGHQIKRRFTVAVLLLMTAQVSAEDFSSVMSPTRDTNQMLVGVKFRGIHEPLSSAAVQR
jgi:hypothetical protein